METKINLSQRERDLIIMVWQKWRDEGFSKGEFNAFIIKNTVAHVVKPPITAEDFRAAVGRDPEQDDLDRCNCSEIGSVGHTSCGWNEEDNYPNWMPKPK